MSQLPVIGRFAGDRKRARSHEGVVLSHTTGRPIEGALVVVKYRFCGRRDSSRGFEATSNEDGIFHLDDIGHNPDEKSYTVVCHAVGFQRRAFPAATSIPSTLVLIPNDSTNCGFVSSTDEVKLDNEEFEMFYRHRHWPFGRAVDSYNKVVAPTGTTFSDLIPGYYHVYSPRDLEDYRSMEILRDFDRAQFGRKVAVEAGKTVQVSPVASPACIRQVTIAVTKFDEAHSPKPLGNCTVRLNLSFGKLKLDQHGKASLDRRTRCIKSNSVVALKVDIGSHPNASRHGPKASHMVGPIHVCTATSLPEVRVDFCATATIAEVPTTVATTTEAKAKAPNKTGSVAGCTLRIIRSKDQTLIPNARVHGLPNPDARMYSLYGLPRSRFLASLEGKVELPHMDDYQRLIAWDSPFGGATVESRPFAETIVLAACTIRGRVHDYKEGTHVRVCIGYDKDVIDEDAATLLQKTVGEVDLDSDGTFRIGCILPRKPFVVFAVRDCVFAGRPLRCEGLQPDEELHIPDIQAPSVGLPTFFHTEPFAKARIYPYVLTAEDSLTVLATRQAVLNGDTLPDGWEADLLPHGVGTVVSHVREERHADCRGVMRVDGFPAGMALLVDTSSGAASTLFIPGL